MRDIKRQCRALGITPLKARGEITRCRMKALPGHDLCHIHLTRLEGRGYGLPGPREVLCLPWNDAGMIEAIKTSAHEAFEAHQRWLERGLPPPPPADYVRRPLTLGKNHKT